MLTTLRTLCLLLILFSMLPAQAAEQSAEIFQADPILPSGVISMRLATAQDTHMAYVKTLQTIAQTIDSRSHGQIKVELLLSGAAGTEAEALQSQIQGRIEGGMTSAITLAHSLPTFRVLSLPLLFNDPNQVYHFMGSPLDRALRQTAENKNLKVLGYSSYGFYGLLAFFDPNQDRPSGSTSLPPVPGSGQTDSQPDSVEKADDYPIANNWISLMENRSIRVPQDEWLIEIHRALPSRLAQAPSSDLQEALSTGWIQGVVATPESLVQTSFPKQATVFFATRHLHGWSVFTVNRAWFDKLPLELQEIVATSVDTVSKRTIWDAFYAERKILVDWSRRSQPKVMQVLPNQLEAIFRPLVFTTSRMLESTLHKPAVIRQLWETNRSPAPAPNLD